MYFSRAHIELLSQSLTKNLSFIGKALKVISRVKQNKSAEVFNLIQTGALFEVKLILYFSLAHSPRIFQKYCISEKNMLKYFEVKH